MISPPLFLALPPSQPTLKGWDPTLVNPCTWFHVTCDSNKHVIHLYDFVLCLFLFPFLFFCFLFLYFFLFFRLMIFLTHFCLFTSYISGIWGTLICLGPWGQSLVNSNI